MATGLARHQSWQLVFSLNACLKQAYWLLQAEVQCLSVHQHYRLGAIIRAFCTGSDAVLLWRQSHFWCKQLQLKLLSLRCHSSVRLVVAAG